jgi:hypothetical protein
LESAVHHCPKNSVVNCSILLIDDYLSLHEVVEAARINGRMTSGNLFAIALVEPNLKEIFCLLFDIVRLQVIDDGNMVYVLPIL